MSQEHKPYQVLLKTETSSQSVLFYLIAFLCLLTCSARNLPLQSYSVLQKI